MVSPIFTKKDGMEFSWICIHAILPVRTLVVPSLSKKFTKIADRICQFSQYLGTKLDMLFKIIKLVQIPDESKKSKHI